MWSNVSGIQRHLSDQTLFQEFRVNLTGAGWRLALCLKYRAWAPQEWWVNSYYTGNLSVLPRKLTLRWHSLIFHLNPKLSCHCYIFFHSTADIVHYPHETEQISVNSKLDFTPFQPIHANLPETPFASVFSFYEPQS